MKKEESRWSLKPNQTPDEAIVYEQDKWRRVDVPLRLRLFHKILERKANLFMEYLDLLPKASELEPPTADPDCQEQTSQEKNTSNDVYVLDGARSTS